MGGSVSLSPDGRRVAIGRNIEGRDRIVEAHDMVKAEVSSFDYPVDRITEEDPEENRINFGFFLASRGGDVLFVPGSVATLMISTTCTRACP